MSEILNDAAAALVQRYQAEQQVFRGEVTLMIAPENLTQAARDLRDEFKFDELVDITAVDYWPQESPRFHLIYQFFSVEHHGMLRLRVPLKGNMPSIATVENLFTGANWYEREVFDMFGIRFDGNHDLRRIIMPYDWQGHPLRKDYPLGYEEVQFTFNFNEIELRKPRPKD